MYVEYHTSVQLLHVSIIFTEEAFCGGMGMALDDEAFSVDEGRKRNQGPHSDVGPRQKTYSSKQYMCGTDVLYAKS